MSLHHVHQTTSVKKTISIIGNGTAGVLSVAYFLSNTDWNITWIYNPDIAPVSVGEGTNLGVPHHLQQSLHFNHSDLLAANGTVKQGVYKKNWGSGSDFLHPFPAGLVAMHFNAHELRSQLSDKITKNPRITVVHQHVEDPYALNTDFVMVCSGTPKNFDDDHFFKDPFVPVDSSYVVQCYWDSPRFTYTISNATKYGWLFAIPLQNRVSVGYMYNSNLNTQEEIKEDLESILKEMQLTPSNDINNVSFTSFYRKHNFSSKVAYNGNASFFLEPLEATSLGFADRVNRLALRVWKKEITCSDAQTEYQTEMNLISGILSMHYMAGSIFDTPFWIRAKSLGNEKFLTEINNNTRFAQQLRAALIDPYGTPLYSEPTWVPFNYYINAVGLTIKEQIDKILISSWFKQQEEEKRRRLQWR